MSGFRRTDDFLFFAEYVRTVSRHVLDERPQAFLDEVVRSATTRERVLVAGTVLWRAQMGCAMKRRRFSLGEPTPVLLEVECPLPDERMLPLRDRASEGRVNAKGIPVLYLADQSETAIKEMRPWVGSRVTVAAFELIRDVLVVDFSLKNTDHAFRQLKSLAEKEELSNEVHTDTVIWQLMDEAFSQPITRTDNLADYAPTQIIAEAIKVRGCGGKKCDGVVFRSSTDKNSKNIALFDVSIVKQRGNCQLYSVTSVLVATTAETLHLHGVLE